MIIPKVRTGSRTCSIQAPLPIASSSYNTRYNLRPCSHGIVYGDPETIIVLTREPLASPWIDPANLMY